jgi:hypothetical protein
VDTNPKCSPVSTTTTATGTRWVTPKNMATAQGLLFSNDPAHGRPAASRRLDLSIIRPARCARWANRISVASTPEYRGRGLSRAGAVLVTRITALSTVYCFAITAHLHGGALSSNLGPLNGGPLSFLFVATQYEIPSKLSISTFHVSVMAITPAIASHKVRHPSPSNFSVFMAPRQKVSCRDLAGAGGLRGVRGHGAKC